MPPDVERALSAIAHADPDGSDTEPTRTAYAEHKAWAVRTYGPDTWAIYVTPCAAIQGESTFNDVP